jgi:hypothetical protein
MEKLPYWVWGFFTNNCFYYTIKESRGKGIPQKILAGSHPLDSRERKIEYKRYSKKIQHIIKAKYKEKDSQRIQTRIANQNTNLITALLYENVPLTNNLAERAIRHIVVIRKISGESKSNNGTLTTAVIMSVLQTLMLQKKNLVKSIKDSIFSSL